MRNKKTFALATAAALALGGMASAAPTPFIGVNFTGGASSTPPIPATGLATSDSAGLVPQSNYNNVDGSAGTVVGLTDAGGATTAVTLTFAGAGTWGTNVGTSTPNQRLLTGYVDGTDNGTNTYTFNNVPAGNYNIIVYSLPDGLDGRDQSISLNGGAPVFSSSDGGADFNANGFVRATATSKDGAGATGNYIEFDNVSPVAGTFALVGTSLNFRNFSNGIQILSSDAPEPATIGLLGLGAVAGLGRRRGKQA